MVFIPKEGYLRVGGELSESLQYSTEYTPPPGSTDGISRNKETELKLEI